MIPLKYASEFSSQTNDDVAQNIDLVDAQRWILLCQQPTAQHATCEQLFYSLVHVLAQRSIFLT